MVISLGEGKLICSTISTGKLYFYNLLSKFIFKFFRYITIFFSILGATIIIFLLRDFQRNIPANSENQIVVPLVTPKYKYYVVTFVFSIPYMQLLILISCRFFKKLSLSNIQILNTVCALYIFHCDTDTNLMHKDTSNGYHHLSNTDNHKIIQFSLSEIV